MISSLAGSTISWSKMVSKLALLILASLVGVHSRELGLPYACGEKRSIHRPYGRVELRVDCELTKGRMWVAEFKGEILHGPSQGYVLATGKRRDSCFYKNDEKSGLSLVWDSLGNVLRRTHFWKGKEVGRTESFFAVGKPGVIRNLDSSGRQQGPQEEWWPNGNKKSEAIAKDGFYISATEYYPNGKPRLRYVTEYSPKLLIFGRKMFAQESWAPDGRSAGKVVDGQGEILLFSADSARGRLAAHREIYKDSLMTDLNEFDSAQVIHWLEVYNRTGKPPKAE